MASSIYRMHSELSKRRSLPSPARLGDKSMTTEEILAKIRKCRGYNIPNGEAFIVFEETNEIWDSEDLCAFIKEALESQSK